MAERVNRDERKNFRVDDILSLADRPISHAEFEEKRSHPGMHARQSRLIKELIGQELVVKGVQSQIDPDLIRGLDLLDAKLNFLIGNQVLHEAQQQQLEERRVNISTTGISFATPAQYQPGDSFVLTLMIPSFPPLIAEVLCEVQWVKPREDRQQLVGATFAFRSEDEQDCIADYVYRRHRELIRLRPAG